MTRIFGMLDTNKKRLARWSAEKYGGRPVSVCGGVDMNRGSMLIRVAALVMPTKMTIYPKTARSGQLAFKPTGLGKVAG
jgi:hypothetical protein